MNLSVLFASFAALLLTSAPVAAQITTIVKKDDVVDDSVVRKFRIPLLSDAAGERIVFRGVVRDANGSQHGIYRVADNGIGVPVAERGDDNLPCEATSYRNFLQPSINANGDIAWFGFLGNGSRGLYRTVGGNASHHRRLVLAGAPVGAVANAVFFDFDAPELTSSNVLVFWAQMLVNGSELRDGIFTLQGGSDDCDTGMGTVDVIAQRGDSVPDSPGLEFCSFNRAIGVSTFNLVFQADVSTSCGVAPQRAGIFRSTLSGSTIETIAVEGDEADLTPTTTYRAFGEVSSVENDGVVAFRAKTTGAVSVEAIFICNPAAGCPATTLPEPIVHGGTAGLKRIERPQITDVGDVVFRANSTTATPKGAAIYVWRAVPGNAPPELIVGRDDPVPGAGPFALFRKLGSHHVSPGGDVVFRGIVKGTDDGWRTAVFLWED